MIHRSNIVIYIQKLKKNSDIEQGMLDLINYDMAEKEIPSKIVLQTDF